MKTLLALLFLPLMASGQANSFRDPTVRTTAASAAATPPMTYADLISFNNTANQTSYTTGAYQPTANALVLAVVINSKATATDTPTFTGNGLTWVLITNVQAFSSTINVSVFRAQGAAPTSTVGVADFGVNTETGCHIRVLQFPNADTSGANGSGAIVQAVTTSAVGTANPSVTMAALTGTANAAFAVVGHSLTSAAFGGSPEAGWTSPWTASYSLPNTGIFGVYQLLSTDNTVAITGASSSWGLVALEVKQQVP